jgi:hypothetical protein
MNYTVDMSSCIMIYIPSLIKIVEGVQTILKFCLENLRRCNVGITGGRVL